MLRNLACAATACLVFASCSGGGPAFRSTDITGAELGRDFKLIDHNGQPRTLADFRGKVLVVFFGFTHCPDVCPITLSELARALKRLGADAQRVQVVMITVDPERDTPEVLKQYVTALDPGFLGLTGDPQAIAETAREFKVFHQKSPGATPQAYSVDHSSGTFVYDPAGRLRLLVGYGQGADVFAHDIGQLLRAG
ncbi:MAG TPA: SCO family protein [Burkholderiales bacterium]|nr:SCO family protein [Burkholderiales bacterium]